MPGKRVYFYPMSSRNKPGEGNPYTKNLIGALSEHFTIVNRKDPSGSGIINLVKYLNGIDILFLNWIEDLPDKKYGYVQTLLFIRMFKYLRRRNVQVCWILHNKFSHYRKNRKLKSSLFRLLASRSTHIITHASEGLTYIRNYDTSHDHNMIFLHHPVMPRTVASKTEKQYDILIWGTLIEYKGVDKFLEYIHQNRLATKYRILIAGRVTDEEYGKKLFRLSGGSIRIENRFVGDEELFGLIGASSIVLFTYKQESVLSSGALMDSLSAGATVMGPDTGAFRDLENEDIVITYSGYEDLLEKADLILTGELKVDRRKLEEFVTENSWTNFGNRLADFIYS